jgi:phosphoserine phosphatase
MPIVNPAPLGAFLARHADTAGEGEKIAVFDCDHTMILGDIGEAMFYRQIREFLFRTTPADCWPDHPRRNDLDRLYRTLESQPPEERTSHEAFGPFADLLLGFYFDQLAAGTVEKGCADIVRLFAGFTREEVHRIADRTFAEELAIPRADMTLGSRRLPAGIRFVREIVDLARALLDRGFSLWAISGSNKWSVEPVFRALGVPRERVIGIDLIEKDGRFTREAEEPVPIRAKKVEALRKRTPVLPLLCASDSRNDIPLLAYASELRVYVNSHSRVTADFFSQGGIRRDDTWVVIEDPGPIEGVPYRG